MDDSVNVIDSVVQQKIDMATGMFESAIYNKYALPLPYHRQNTLTFSGTGSGAGTLTVVINGTDYAITIFTGMTGAQAADAFREVAVDSTDFITMLSSERSEEGEIVTIISKTDSGTLTTANAEVNITNAGGTVAGITGAEGRRSDKYSAFVTQIVGEIAAALLLTDNYGVEGQDTPKDGEARLERVQEVLLQLQGDAEGKPDLNLIDDVTKVEFPGATGDNPNFFPTLASKTDTDDPTNSKVTINGEK